MMTMTPQQDSKPNNNAMELHVKSSSYNNYTPTPFSVLSKNIPSGSSSMRNEPVDPKNHTHKITSVTTSTTGSTSPLSCSSAAVCVPSPLSRSTPSPPAGNRIDIKAEPTPDMLISGSTSDAVADDTAAIAELGRPRSLSCVAAPLSSTSSMHLTSEGVNSPPFIKQEDRNNASPLIDTSKDVSHMDWASIPSSNNKPATADTAVSSSSHMAMPTSSTATSDPSMQQENNTSASPNNVDGNSNMMLFDHSISSTNNNNDTNANGIHNSNTNNINRPNASNNLPKNVNSRRQKRLERNRESARLSRRRRKQYLEVLEERVSMLSDEMDRGRCNHVKFSMSAYYQLRHSLLCASTDSKLSNETNPAINNNNNNNIENNQQNTDSGTKNNLSLEQVARQLSYASRTSDELRVAATFQKEQLSSFAFPISNKFILWLTLQNDTYFRGGRATSERLSAARIGERILFSSPNLKPRVSLSHFPSNYNHLNGHNDNNSTRTSGTNAGEVNVNPISQMWPLFCNEIGLSYDQEERVRNYQKTLLAQPNSFLHRHTGYASYHTIQSLHSAVQAVHELTRQREARVLSILTLPQKIKYLQHLHKKRLSKQQPNQSPNQLEDPIIPKSLLDHHVFHNSNSPNSTAIAKDDNCTNGIPTTEISKDVYQTGEHYDVSANLYIINHKLNQLSCNLPKAKGANALITNKKILKKLTRRPSFESLASSENHTNDEHNSSANGNQNNNGKSSGKLKRASSEISVDGMLTDNHNSTANNATTTPTLSPEAAESAARALIDEKLGKVKSIIPPQQNRIVALSTPTEQHQPQQDKNQPSTIFPSNTTNPNTNSNINNLIHSNTGHSAPAVISSEKANFQVHDNPMNNNNNTNTVMNTSLPNTYASTTQVATVYQNQQSYLPQQNNPTLISSINQRNNNSSTSAFTSPHTLSSTSTNGYASSPIPSAQMNGHYNAQTNPNCSNNNLNQGNANPSNNSNNTSQQPVSSSMISNSIRKSGISLASTAGTHIVPQFHQQTQIQTQQPLQQMQMQIQQPQSQSQLQPQPQNQQLLQQNQQHQLQLQQQSQPQPQQHQQHYQQQYQPVAPVLGSVVNSQQPINNAFDSFVPNPVVSNTDINNPMPGHSHSVNIQSSQVQSQFMQDQHEQMEFSIPVIAPPPITNTSSLLPQNQQQQMTVNMTNNGTDNSAENFLFDLMEEDWAIGEGLEF